jgi:hypothetical protein
MVTALVRHLGIEDDPECMRAFIIGKSKFKRYSAKAYAAHEKPTGSARQKPTTRG